MGPQPAWLESALYAISTIELDMAEQAEDTAGSAKGGRHRPIFHIGAHKTATNWFQKRFYPHVAGYRYVHRRLVRATLLGRSPLAFDAAAARRALGLDDGSPAIICEEDLSGVLHNGGLLSNYIAKEIASQLHSIAPGAQIVLFVREQASLAASCYHQYVREGGTGSVRRYLFPEDYIHLDTIRPLKVPRFDFSAFEFDRLVAHYDSLFGKENVHVFAFEEFARVPQEFLSRFCEALEIDLPEGLDLSPLNSSYRAGLIPIARTMNLFTRRSVAEKTVILHLPGWYPVRKVILESFNRIPVFGRPPPSEKLLGSEISRWIRDHFAASNRCLQTRMGIDLSELGYSTRNASDTVVLPRRPRLLRWLKF
jgi:hypothetical protein